MTDALTLQLDRTVVRRGWVIAVAAAAIILGLVAFLIPDATLLTVAIVFGVFLIVSGTAQLIHAFTSGLLITWARWLVGLLGALTLVAGVLTLSDPWVSLSILGVFIGLGWIFTGVSSLLERSGRKDWKRWLPIVSGLVSIIAGVIAMIMPILALRAYVLVAAILLIIVGVATLLQLSTGAKAAREAAVADGSV